MGDGGAGIPLPNKFWSVLFVLLSHEEVAPPNADEKSAKSPSWSLLGLLTEFPKPKLLPLLEDELLLEAVAL